MTGKCVLKAQSTHTITNCEIQTKIGGNFCIQCKNESGWILQGTACVAFTLTDAAQKAKFLGCRARDVAGSC